MTATIQRAPASVAVFAPADQPDAPLLYHLVLPADAADAALAPTSQEARLLLCMWQVVAKGRPEAAPTARTPTDGDVEDALTWEDAAWQ